MNACNHDMVFIPGWGFSSDIGHSFFKGKLNSCKFLDLPYLKHANIMELIKYLSEKIPDHSSIVGWSLGGLIAIKLSAVFPKKVSRLILIGSTPKFTAAPDWVGVSSNVAQQFKRSAEDNLAALGYDFLKSVCFPSRNKIGKCVRDNFLKGEQDKTSWFNYLDILLDSDFRQDYRVIQSPILHVMGDQDLVTKVDRDALLLLNSKTQLMSIAGAGHAPFLSHSDALLDRRNFRIHKR